jgi:hypothetical protein
VPENLTLTAAPIALGAVIGVGIKAIWDEPIREGLSFIAEYRPTGGSWANMAVNQDEFTAMSPVVDSAVQHEVRVKAVTLSGRESDWTPVETITPTVSNPYLYDSGGNALSAPEDFLNAAWTVDSSGAGSSNPIRTANQAADPGNGNRADRLQFTRGASGFSRLRQAAAVTNGVTYQFAVWLRAPSAGASIALRLDGNNGTTLNLTTQWQRYTLTATAASASMDVQLLLWSSIAGAPTSAEVFAWGAQLRAA